MYYIIRLSEPNLFVKRTVAEERVIYSLVPTSELATEFSELETMSFTLIASEHFIYVDVETHKNNMNQQKHN